MKSALRYGASETAARPGKMAHVDVEVRTAGGGCQAAQRGSLSQLDTTPKLDGLDPRRPHFRENFVNVVVAHQIRISQEKNDFRFQLQCLAQGRHVVGTSVRRNRR